MSSTPDFQQLLLMISREDRGQSIVIAGPINACDLESYSSARNASSARVMAWVEQLNYRGTFDILWICLITTGISTYTMLCLNIPAPKDTYMQLIGRRILWMILGIMGPEFVLIYAAGQWSRAKWSVKAFKEAGYHEWHMRQAFLTDMGGFVFHTQDSTAFPLNATQLLWLVRHKYVEFPSVTKREIWDKSKQDTFTKVVTAFQVSYLIIQCAACAAQRLTITTLELNALAIVVCSLMTSLDEIAGNRDWDLTPLNFVDENEPGYSVNVQPFMKMPVIPAERPIQRIPNDRFPTNPYGIQEYLLCFATLLFSGIHVAGWNFDFPTATERILWRVSSLLLFGITAAFWLFETMASWTRLGREDLEKHEARLRRKGTLTVARKMTELPLPWEFATITPLAIVYGIERVYLIGEAFAELRNISATAYVNVEWTNFIPHV
ncbi:hypothetical protein EJ07DRAFT_167513 [Lizonia empirigonia]|nr:hypothetical protein EJ07DRAFT_167513 [Lizonia empirigonia]